jgi:hypothetical protein
MIVMMKRFAMLLLLAISMPRDAVAQDTQYWNLQYGTKGELLGGVVVGSALDMSATFYNPAAVAWVVDPSFILTASVFGMQTLKVVGEDPDQAAITSTRFGPLPSMFAGVLPMKWFGGRTAYSFFTRQQLDFRMSANDGVVIGRDEPGDTLSVGGEIVLEDNMGENWGGFSWAKKVGEKGSLGATVFGVYRSQYTRQQQTVEAFGAGGYGAAALVTNELDYYNVRALAKIGLYFDLSGTTLGLSVTTPSADLFGSGDVISNESLIGDVDADSTGDSRANMNYGEGLDTEYRSPFSIALGASHKFKRLTGHISVEYFEALDEYTVVDSPAGVGGPGVTSVEVRYDHAATDVFNWGVGIEQDFGDQNSFYVSFITDQSSYQTVAARRVVVSTWDIHHLNGGVALSIKDIDFTLGGGFAWGQNQAVADTRTGVGVLPATVVPAEIGYSRLKFIVGFAL